LNENGRREDAHITIAAHESVHKYSFKFLVSGFGKGSDREIWNWKPET
jgi:hypothetical protein